MVRLSASWLIAVAVAAAPLVARAGPAVRIEEVDVPTVVEPWGSTSYGSTSSAPRSLARGPDGKVWFTEECGKKIGRVTPDLSDIAEYAAPSTFTCTPNDPPNRLGYGLHGIIAGPDGNMWYLETAANVLGKITTKASPGGQEGIVTQYDVTPRHVESCASGTGLHFVAITPKDPNALWVTQTPCNYVGRIPITGDDITPKTVKWRKTDGDTPVHIGVGPDGDLWFSQNQGTGIGKVTLDANGAFLHIGELPLPPGQSGRVSPTAGPDGNLWYTRYADNAIGRITPDERIDEFRLQAPASGSSNSPGSLTTAADGAMWFTEISADRFARMTPDPSDEGRIDVEEWAIPYGRRPNSLISGPDGNVWFGQLYGNKIAKVTLPRAAYVRADATDAAARAEFRDLLEEHGYVVDAVSLAGAETFDFSSYQVIVMAADTGHDGGFGVGWSWSGTDAALGNILRARKPVVGIWLGGASFFSRVPGLAIGYGNAWIQHAGWGQVTVVDPAGAIWHEPNPVTIGAAPGSPLTLYDRGTAAYVSVYDPGGTAGVTRLAGEPGDSGHYPIISQTLADVDHVLWGYPDPPSYMSPSGRSVFLNVLGNLAGLRRATDRYTSYKIVRVQASAVATHVALGPMDIDLDEVATDGAVSVVERAATPPGSAGGKIRQLMFDGVLRNGRTCVRYTERDTGGEATVRMFHRVCPMSPETCAAGSTFWRWVDITTADAPGPGVVCGGTWSY